MAVSFSENGPEDDEYIDMEITSFSNFFSNSRASREFEFQMSSLSMEREPTTSPADELFYKGKLLPLHLPPHLLDISESGFDSGYGDKNGVFGEFYGTPLATAVTTPTSTSTPFESCNISPCDSCSVSRELNPDEYSFYENEYSAETDVSRRWIGESENLKKSWTKKALKLSSRLKASRAYLKSVFGKSSCSYESAAATKDGNRGTIPNPKSKRSQFRQMNQDKGKKLVDNGTGNGRSNLHRRSFSMAIKRHSSTNKSSTSSSSSSSSSNSNGSNSFQSLQSLKRNGSVNVKIESPIQGAIAHCKRSQMSSRKPAGDAGFSLSASDMAVCEDQERPDLWRG
ncbi:hypothetical protein GQ457_14G023010 [Hibiscus cannabinus]